MYYESSFFFFHDLLQKKTHLSLSHALLISNLRAMCPTFPVFFIFIWWRVSKVTRMLFEISLSHWKALCDSKMIWGKTLFNLLANTLEISLYKILHSAIGQNLEIYYGLLTLGIRVMKVWFKPDKILTELRQERIALTTSSPMLV